MTYGANDLEQRMARFLKESRGTIGNPQPVSMEEIGIIQEALEGMKLRQQTFGEASARVGIALVWTLGLGRARDVVEAAVDSRALDEEEGQMLQIGLLVAAAVPPPLGGRLIPIEAEMRRAAQAAAGLRTTRDPILRRRIRRLRIPKPEEPRIIHQGEILQ